MLEVCIRKFVLSKFQYHIWQRENDKAADQTVWMGKLRLVCSFAVHMQQSDFLTERPDLGNTVNP